MNDSIRLFGVPDLPAFVLRQYSPVSEARLKRHRRALKGLTDRQLLNRYERYLRGADRAVAWVSIQRTLNATGLLQQQLARLKVARDVLRDRGVRPPKRWEAYLHQSVRETYLANEDLLHCLTNGRARTASRVSADLEATAGRLRRDSVRREDYQRWMMLLALQEAQRLEDPRARRLIEHLQSKLGWRFKHVEAERLLAAVER